MYLCKKYFYFTDKFIYYLKYNKYADVYFSKKYA